MLKQRLCSRTMPETVQLQHATGTLVLKRGATQPPCHPLGQVLFMEVLIP